MNATNETDFNKAYWLSKPKEVRALEVNTTPDQDARMSRGIELAIKGFQIDVPIMLWGWSPFKVMKLRIDYGYTWTPNALQPPVQLAPGLSGSGLNLVPYDPNNPPGGAIKVSLDLADYPAFDPPVPATPLPTVSAISGDPVGVWMGYQNLYYSVPGVDTRIDGDTFTDPRGSFRKHITVTPFGRSPYWEKIA